VRKIKKILRLKWGLGLSARQVGASLRISHSTVGEYLKRAEQAGLDWAQVEGMLEAAIAEQLFPPKESK
jgi:DNA-binding transcriptional regulator LsrR (DeoR family)